MKYNVTYKDKVYVYNAKTAVEAIDKLNNRKVFGKPIFFDWKLTMFDADTRGAEWAEGRTDEGIRLFAEKAEQND